MRKNVDWESYKSELIETVRLNGIELMNETNVSRMAECVTGWIQEMNGKYMKECERWCGRKIAWWTRELSVQKSKVRKKRREWQRARKNGCMDVEERKREYKRALNDYKSRMRSVKEDNWKHFVSESSNLDPCPVYKVCRGNTARQGLSALCVNGNNYSTWNDGAEKLLEFFPDFSQSLV